MSARLVGDGEVTTILTDFTGIPDEELERIQFTVDSALLQELGERLVGKPYIALAELVKNSYDADATRVVIRFGTDTIEIIDNGHGMDFEEFQSFWMRVGSQHKQEQKFSRNFNRPFTGSKGVGRLAVQFLARRIMMRSVSDRGEDLELDVFVNWDEAVRAGDLTEATAQYRKDVPTLRFPEDKPHGTAIILSRLNQDWTTKSIVELAQEIWPLQPPFRTDPDRKKTFIVELESPDEEAVQRFDEQMHAVLDIWTARIFGKLSPTSDDSECKVHLVCEFLDGERYVQEYSIHGCKLHNVEFEIRVYTLERRQPFGIRVSEAREYFRRFGGIHVYDAGFHLPYYGYIESDWLSIQYDQASRKHRSLLLPDELQIPRGLQFLPTNSRLFGVVHVNTSLEQRLADKRSLDADVKEGYLKIQVTRDRLVDNAAYQNLVDIVRWALDFYAMREAARQFQKTEEKRPTEPVREKIVRVDRILASYREDIPRPVYLRLQREIRDAIQASDTSSEVLAAYTGLLGSLATVGMSVLAFEHEAKKQHSLLVDIVNELDSIHLTDEEMNERMKRIVDRQKGWLVRSRALRSLFTSLMEEESRTKLERNMARALIRDVSRQLFVLMRGIRPQLFRVDEDLRLPPARYAEWSSIFQNVFLNSLNAMLDSTERKIDVSSRIDGRRRELWIQDTGVGVDLSTAEELFKPFVRKLEISQERRDLGVGGSGLGLTIVRMIADSIGCSVEFVEPEDGYKTALRILWREKE